MNSDLIYCGHRYHSSFFLEVRSIRFCFLESAHLRCVISLTFQIYTELGPDTSVSLTSCRYHKYLNVLLNHSVMREGWDQKQCYKSTEQRQACSSSSFIVSLNFVVDEKPTAAYPKRASISLYAIRSAKRYDDVNMHGNIFIYRAHVPLMMGGNAIAN